MSAETYENSGDGDSLGGEIFLISWSHLLASLRVHSGHSEQIFLASLMPQ